MRIVHSLQRKKLNPLARYLLRSEVAKGSLNLDKPVNGINTEIGFGIKKNCDASSVLSTRCGHIVPLQANEELGD